MYTDSIQSKNIVAAKAVAGIIRTTLGPRSMLKMIIDNQGGIIITNDGHCVLREIEIEHPAARSLIDLSKTQDNEIGDGTTTVVVLAAEFLRIAEILLKQKLHPNQIISSFYQALIDVNFFLQSELSFSLEKNNIKDVVKVIMTSICTKLVGKFSRLMCELAIKAIEQMKNKKEVSNMKTFFKIEKISSGKIEQSRILSGIMFAKDIAHPKMKRYIVQPKILLLDCPIEFKKGESQTLIEMNEEDTWQKILKAEENYIIFLCNLLKNFRPDVIITEKGVSDLALHYLYKSNISVIRRVKKSDNIRIAKATGATIITSIEEIENHDFGLSDTFEIKKIGEEYFTFITGCKDGTSCTALLFGSSRDVLDEIERNLQDALSIAKDIFSNQKIIPGGGATELAIGNFLSEKSENQKNSSFFIYKSLSLAFEIIPKTLTENYGDSVIFQLNKLKTIHKQKGIFFGLDGRNGKIVDMRKINVWETCSLKMQLVKSAIENATLLLRVDRIISGLANKKK
ncbi:T-complex protein gamma SU (nucleomorph) [Chroomonas mesostigmatica CCMP1168]|uniref:T-complex protein 1 subunit gamma n=1 Tax=Chroomonas mesostigmatica CCMP1168 TaxID=1195612 RepID=J7G8K9_9CRYP|nr:T-complex protein gamma SU [Chroomonas mesostigmatica CCMP1168]